VLKLVVSLLDTLLIVVLMEAVLAAMLAFHRPRAEPRMVELRLSFAMPLLRLTRDIMASRIVGTQNQESRRKEVVERVLWRPQRLPKLSGHLP
jgi:hypothetical protein